MTEYEDLKRICEDNSALSARWIDDFMMYYAASHDGLERDMEMQFKRFRHVTSTFPQSVINRMKAQYVVHRVFKAGGLIRKYLNHVEVKSRGAEALDFFARQLQKPWRFSFATVIDIVAPDFFQMVDVFSEEQYLLYSPGMSQTFNDYNESVVLWFNLIAFNGRCWQTYGPIGAYKSIDVDDVFFFAGELDDRISDESEVLALIESRPVPFMMLISGGNVPVLVQGGSRLVIQTATIEFEWTSADMFQPEFEVAYAHEVVRLSLPPWSQPMHYAHVYVDREAGELFCFAMTDAGFAHLIEALGRKGVHVEYPDVVVNVSSILIMERILQKKITLNAYEVLFDRVTDPGAHVEKLEKINALLQKAIEDKNAGRNIDYEEYAQMFGLEIEQVRKELDPLIAEMMRLLGKN